MSFSNESFIDETFRVMANVVFRLTPATKLEKKAFLIYMTGIESQLKGEYRKAIKEYEKALPLEENNIDCSFIHYNLGLIYLKLIDYNNLDDKNFKKGFRHLRQAIKDNSSFSEAQHALGVLHHLRLTALKKRLKDKRIQVKRKGLAPMSEKLLAEFIPLITTEETCVTTCFKWSLLRDKTRYPYALNWLQDQGFYL